MNIFKTYNSFIWIEKNNNKKKEDYFGWLGRGCILTEFLFTENVDEGEESTDVILYKRGDEPRFAVSSREWNACKRYQWALSSITFGSKKNKFYFEKFYFQFTF